MALQQQAVGRDQLAEVGLGHRRAVQGGVQAPQGTGPAGDAGRPVDDAVVQSSSHSSMDIVTTPV